jgi:hypothetical protein
MKITIVEKSRVSIPEVLDMRGVKLSRGAYVADLLYPNQTESTTSIETLLTSLFSLSNSTLAGT